ncbi:MAG: hypothetical protein QM488_14495 [Rhizobiaceae bacterium]
MSLKIISTFTAAAMSMSILAVPVGVTAVSSFTIIPNAQAANKDPCAGQKWPNYTQDCIDHIVKTISTAGGGNSSSNKAIARKLIVSGKIKANTSRRAIRRLLKKNSLTPRRGGNSKAPATIDCNIESSEECQKIVICSPNCSTEQMQGGDCC